MSDTFASGYMALDKEITLDELPIEGTIPTWLSGSLLRNGPAKFEVGPDKFRHWFDGFAMLHRFSFQHGRVSYANKFLQSTNYKVSLQEGRIALGGFATDPCKAIFKGSMTEMIPNANVSINKVADEFVAMTEVPMAVKFDPHTLETLGVTAYEDQLSGHHGSAHPHYDFASRASISYITEFARESQFKVFSIEDGTYGRKLIGAYLVQEPAYIHSFGLSEHYIIIAEFPYRVNPLKLLARDKPFIENYEWRPQEGAYFVVMNRQDGSVLGRFKTEAFFTFHHINAFEQDGALFVDLSAYPSPAVVNDIYLEQLRGNPQQVDSASRSMLRRYRIPLDASAPVTYEVLSEYGIELPTINYKRCNTHEYGVAYGVGSSKEHPEAVSNLLLRVDVRRRLTKIWSQEDCYPGEPVLVEVPGAQEEDDGVILSVVLNARKGNSFLLILDAHTFDEIGRAEVPHHIPFGFHGQFFRNVQ
ncbi:carotenoid oxygenase family protein [Ktedonosporobacter rubrisoli]|uniref:Carotenoid oxygenase family protein n=1 Tax=Ktedonosporobacter rubrisoli TaxID=2509675 RepID=A0A4P6JPA0_KTERU|nr:carotenoid oxygenase family protein [Ktedonosporobacter rubrisoli]QBD76960.1 carotenoid oxygenase family protein [Ktedonosporobacter rubrisoli]